MELKAYAHVRGSRSHCLPVPDEAGDPYAGAAAYDAAVDALTRGGIDPLGQMERSLGAYDRAALAVLMRHRELRVEPASVGRLRRVGSAGSVLSLYLNARGRLYIRPATDANVDRDDAAGAAVGDVMADASVIAEIDGIHRAWQRSEAAYLAQIRAAIERLVRDRELPRALADVSERLAGMQSACCYVGDRFVTLVDERGRAGWLDSLRATPYAQWTDDDVLIFAALYLFVVSGRAACFDEFGGALLTARDLISRANQAAHHCADSDRGRRALEGRDAFGRAAALSEFMRR
jgi:hypothetical protein